MAKGTLLASATTTKKGGVSSRGGTGKTAKSSIVGSQEGGSSSTSTGGSAASKTGKKSKTASTAASKASKKSAPKPQVSEESDAGDDDDVVFVEREGNDGPRHLDPKGRKYDKHYKAVVRDALGGMDLLYPEEQTKVETILKLFDLEPEYGPAAGMTRLERWQRAANWGLNPPAEVYDILTTIEGGSKENYRESLYYGRV